MHMRATVISCMLLQYFGQCVTDDDLYSTHATVRYMLTNKDERHLCLRNCTRDAIPMVCYYRFKIEWYMSMSKACYQCPLIASDCHRKDCVPGDGTERVLVVVNRKMPGPKIEVCEGDKLIIDVENRLDSDSTTVHWHGMHQRTSPYMDGVPFVTQCPIPPGTNFRYHFHANNPGTHFWHSHSGMQRGDGMFGALVIRKRNDSHRKLYDYDLSNHIIIVLDWTRQQGIDKFLRHHHSNGDNKPDAILVNGLAFTSMDADTNAEFFVENGLRYRFRVINAGFLNCPIEMSIDEHNMTIISSDGGDLEPVEVESFVSYAGERYDFVLNAMQPSKKRTKYLMKFKGLLDCDERFNKVFQLAVITYENNEIGTEHFNVSLRYEDINHVGMQINSLNMGVESDSALRSSLPTMKSLVSWDDSLKEFPEFKYYISYDFYGSNNPRFHKAPYYGFQNISERRKRLLTPQLNYITMKLQPFPLLSQRYQVDPQKFCNESTVGLNCQYEFCACTHVVNLNLDDVVELILIDKGNAFDANHPFHLHGHSFRVVAMERLGLNTSVSEVLRRDLSGRIHRNLVDPPLKDTVTVPDGGYTILRFKANNPGYWLFHCHIEYHIELGMSLVFKVGSHDDMPPVPDNFPQCGNYDPNPFDKYGYITSNEEEKFSNAATNENGDSFYAKKRNEANQYYYSMSTCLILPFVLQAILFFVLW